MPTSALAWSIHRSFRLSGAFTSCHDQCPSLARSSIIKHRVVEIVYPVLDEPCNVRPEVLMYMCVCVNVYTFKQTNKHTYTYIYLEVNIYTYSRR